MASFERILPHNFRPKRHFLRESRKFLLPFYFRGRISAVIRPMSTTAHKQTRLSKAVKRLLVKIDRTIAAAREAEKAREEVAALVRSEQRQSEEGGNK